MLFDENAKIEGPKLPQHSPFEYLEGSTRPGMQDVRSKVLEWWTKFPSTEQAGIKSRLKADPVSFSSAMFELLVHETLTRAGHVVLEIEPNLPNTNKRPDFKMRDPAGKEYILELTEARDQTVAQAASAKRRSEIEQRINGIGSGDFFVDVWWLEEPTSLDGIASDIASIKDWLLGLDYEAEKNLGISILTPKNQRPNKKINKENYKFELSAYPRNNQKSAGSPCLGMNTDGFKDATSESALKSSIKTKASRYGDLGMPYFIAINIHDFAIDTESETGAFFGPVKLVIEHGEQPGTEVNRYLEHSGEGLFIRNANPVNTRVSGVWLFRNISHVGGNSRRSCVYYHPHAKHAMELDVDTETFRVLEDGSSERRTGQSMNALLGLASDWPQID